MVIFLSDKVTSPVVTGTKGRSLAKHFSDSRTSQAEVGRDLARLTNS